MERAEKTEKTKRKEPFSLPDFIIKNNHKIEVVFIVFLIISLLLFNTGYVN